jgi:CelD/BcsL family acetyltransferase involved in cellulose biosynthesis
LEFSAGWPAYLDWARGAHAKSLKNATGGLRRLREQYSEVEFRYPDTDPGALAWLVAAKTEQCLRKGWRDVFAEQWVLELSERLVAEQTDGFGGIVATLRADGEIVAAVFGVRSSCVLAGSILAHAPQFSRFNPGWAGLLALGEAAAAAGLVRLDLGDGAEAFKQKLGNARIELGRGAVGRPGVVGRLVLTDESIRRGISSFGALHPGAERTARRVVRKARRLGYVMGAPLSGMQERR